MSTVNAVLFDVYETLLHNERHLWLATFDEICRAQGLPIDGTKLYSAWRPHDLAFRKERVVLEDLPNRPPFKSYYETWRGCFVLAFRELDIPGDAEAATKAVVDALAQRKPYEDALAALPSIQARWRTGILSNADDYFLVPSLRGAGMEFEMVFSSEQGRSYKPDPALFEESLRRMGLTAEETVYVGDTPHEDVLGSSLVGMRVAWINRNGAERPDSLPSPDFEIRALTELIPVLDGKG